MNNKGKRLILAAALLLLYLALLGLLVLTEKGADGAGIYSLPLAFWYSLTTLTTVGYGDLYPVTAWGRVIGAVFQLMSLGVLVSLVGLLLRILRGRWLPVLRLKLLRKKDWYVFSAASTEALVLARAIHESEPDAVLIFLSGENDEGVRESGGMLLSLPLRELIGLKKTGKLPYILCMDSDPAVNERLSAEADALGAESWCLSEHEPDKLPPTRHFFHAAECCARSYWKRYPLKDARETIVLAGEGAFAEALLEQALLTNVVSPDQSVRYVLIGDWSDFCRCHPYLDRFADLSGEDSGRDSLVFAGEVWDQDWAPYQDADRVILCWEDENVTADRLSRLQRYCPVSAPVHARLSWQREGVITFGSQEEIFTPENVLREELNQLAVRLHGIYCANAGGVQPGWNEIGSFLRRSNLASADHLTVKSRILLDGREDFEEAFRVWSKLDPAGHECCRRIEHERWSRFHLMNNWKYAPVRDNAKRLHPMLVPFEQLSEADQAKDDGPWKLLSDAAGLGLKSDRL